MVQFRVLAFISSLYQIQLGLLCGVTFNLIPNRIEFCHWQILIETATHSLGRLPTQK